MIRNNLWTEKYRPTSVDELALSEENRSFLQKCLEDEEIPDLLFSGPPGTGKSTLAKILVNELDCRHIFLNASDERGIDTIREKVGTFAKSKMASRWNVVVMDEADALTRDAQTAMRSLVEEYSNQTRYILTANYPQKLISPIRSRFTEIQLSEIPIKERAKVLARIVSEEGVKTTKEAIVSYAKTYTDMRRMLIAARKSCLIHGELLPAKESTIDGNALWSLVAGKKWKQLVEVSKDPNTDHQQMLIDLFWAVPDSLGPKAAQHRSTIEEKISSSTFAPDSVVHFLGCCATLMKEM